MLRWKSVRLPRRFEVQANTALVETQATGISQVIENQRILELPLNGRQATDLIVLAGAAGVFPPYGGRSPEASSRSEQALIEVSTALRPAASGRIRFWRILTATAH